MVKYTEVLFDEMPGVGGNIGIITLNRPQVLNSLNHAMVHAMQAQLKRWATARDIKAVVIRAAEGRAFCAGGDLRLTYDRAIAKNSAAMDFFRDEYQLNRCIFHFPKPYIALLDGITMGGGVGISLHGSHRVATEDLLFAMPETGIGFFPDVGGTYFLPRLPANIGYYLGLTGARIHCDDAVAAGLAQHKVAKESLSLLIDAIAKQPFKDDANASVTEIIERFEDLDIRSELMESKKIVRDCFAHTSIEEIENALRAQQYDFARKTLDMLSKKSPTSLKVSLKAMQEGANLDFDQCMAIEYRLSCHFARNHDFIEGIRAVIIDKDHTPIWVPNTVAAVTPETVNKYFDSVAEELN